MRKVKEVSRITVEFQRDELIEILDIMSTVRDAEPLDSTTMQVAGSWADSLVEIIS
jgi:hypothetical protein